MAAPLRTRRFTVDEYHRMGDAGVLREDDRVELLDGQIVVMTPIGSRHAATVTRLTHLFSHLVGNDLIVSVQNPIVLGRHWEPQPDVCLLRPRPDFYAAAHPRADDVLLAVEVADTSAEYDRERKIREYARSRVAESWLVDLTGDVVEVYREPSAEGYRDVRVLKRGDGISPLHFPTAAIPVDEVLGPQP